MRRGGVQAWLFPQSYHPAVLVSAAALGAGFLTLETLLHGRHAASVVGRGLAVSAAQPRAFWEAFYYLGYLWYVVPVALRELHSVPGLLRRLLVALGLQLGIGALGLFPLELDLVPCLNVSSAFLVFRVSLASGPLWLRALSAAVLALVSGATLATQRHDVNDVLVGMLLGLVTHALAFSKELGFLEQSRPWNGIDFELRDLQNLLVGNRRDNWEAAYEAGQWEFLRAPKQRPRHHTIAGLIADAFPDGAAILDVGCGYGTLWEMAAPRGRSYTGVDLSTQVVKKCRELFAGDRRCAFVQSGFEEYQPGKLFDVVVLNEVLYYFPLSSVDAVVDKALSLLKEGGVLVVSMNRNLKARWIWRMLRSRRESQSVRVTNLATGSYWTVKTYVKGRTR